MFQRLLGHWKKAASLLKLGLNMSLRLKAVKSSGNGNSRGRGFIPDNGVGAGGGIRTHVAQRTTGFQAAFPGLSSVTYRSAPYLAPRITVVHYALGDPGTKL